MKIFCLGAYNWEKFIYEQLVSCMHSIYSSYNIELLKWFYGD